MKSFVRTFSNGQPLTPGDPSMCSTAISPMDCPCTRLQCSPLGRETVMTTDQSYFLNSSGLYCLTGEGFLRPLGTQFSGAVPSSSLLQPLNSGLSRGLW